MKKPLKKEKITRDLFVVPIAALIVGVVCGWLIRGEQEYNLGEKELSTLRLDGYKLISPLLVCDTTPGKTSAGEQVMEKKLQSVVEKAKQMGNITSASIYFRNIKSGGQVLVNENEKYFPASLNKVPVMMAYFKEAQKDPNIFSKKITVSFTNDINGSQEIKPAQTVKSGETHKVIDLIERMIKFSDNNAAYALINNIDRAKIDQTSKDLKVAYPRQEVIDYITVNDFSYFLRVLYNATYLRSDLSERALELLGGIDFKDGLVAGVPSGITVAHKFGLQTGYNSVGIVEKRELHDCGIIYNEKSPYVLCIMTKSGDSFEGAKSTIKSISALVWEEVSKGQ